jgi:hypothetical protein
MILCVIIWSIQKIKEITMKKTLLLSVIASTMIMAGGDIDPVEPVVETPDAVASVASGWDFSGQAVVYGQTDDKHGKNDLFKQASNVADAGLQLRAVNKDLFGGVGAGVEVSGLTTLGLEHAVVSNVMEAFGDKLKGGWISQAYLTYAAGNTSFKVGRQELPKALSPFAFSEGWNVFKNTFDSALVVNTDIEDTTLVGAWVHAANGYADMSNFGHLNDNDGVYMLTAQNKSIEGLTLTGTYYYAPEKAGDDDLNVIWGDAKFAISDYSVALQGGTLMADQKDDTIAFGAKAGANFGMFDASVAYSFVNDNDTATVQQLGGPKTPLYTQMVLNQGVISDDAGYLKLAASAKALGGKFGIAYGVALDSDKRFVDNTTGENPYELDVTYKTKVFDNTTTLFAGYILQDGDVKGEDARNVIRVWGRYNF